MAICLVPARCGSKRIPDKNIREVNGAPMMHWPLRAAVASGIFNRVLVSTDSVRYVDIAREIAGVDAFYRDPSTATDTAPLEAVLVDAMRRLPREAEWCLLMATAIGTTAYRLREIQTTFREGGFRALACVTRDEKSAARSMVTTPEGGLVPLSRAGIVSRTQDMPNTYHDAGQMYWLRKWPFLWRWVMLGQDILLQRPYGYLLKGAVDIDTNEDLEEAAHA